MNKQNNWSRGEMDITRVFGSCMISNSLYRQSKIVKKVKCMFIIENYYLDL